MFFEVFVVVLIIFSIAFVLWVWTCVLNPADLGGPVPSRLPDRMSLLPSIACPVLIGLLSVSMGPKACAQLCFCNVLCLDLNEAVPETERLDSKAVKTRAQLSVKSRRQRPSRTRLYDSVSSTDGEDSLERKVSPRTAVLASAVFCFFFFLQLMG